ncbi:MAG: ABC transporter ATP-binding protein [Chitinophagaceae bacterium]
MNLLEVKNLRKYFATQKAVDDVSFTVEKGTIFGLLGPNGAGKTTLLRMITGIFYPDDGEITFDGRKFDPIEDVHNIGYMPEERGLYKKMKIGEQAIYLTQLKGLSKADAIARIKEWFEKFEMQSWWNKKVEDLSKGMSQKLQFVTTVLHDPPLIILDEPFSGLDPVNSNLIKDEMFRLAKKGHTIIFSTHRMEQVEEICDKIVVINRGKKILDGKVSAIRQQYKENLFRISFDQLPVMTDSPIFQVSSSENAALIVKINEGYKTNDLLEFFIRQNASLESFNELLPSINDIFIRLVRDAPAARQFQNVTD